MYSPVYIGLFGFGAQSRASNWGALISRMLLGEHMESNKRKGLGIVHSVEFGRERRVRDKGRRKSPSFVRVMQGLE